MSIGVIQTLLGVSLALLYAVTISDASYMITAPKYARHGSDYTIAFAVSGQKKDINVMCEIVRRLSGAGKYYMKMYEEAYPGEAYEEKVLVSVKETIKKKTKYETIVMKNLDIPPTHQNFLTDYLVITTTGGIKETFEQRLNTRAKSLSVNTQTDKANYKPGDTVKFRTFLTDAMLKPVVKPLKIQIKNPDGNTLRQWLNVTSDSGVFSDSMELASQTIQGNWQILVKAMDDSVSMSKTFEVKEYVLPKFEVKVQMPPFALFVDDSYPVTVTAMYTYGEPVKGYGVLSVRTSAYQCKNINPVKYNRDIYNCETHQVALKFKEGKAEYKLKKKDLVTLFKDNTNGRTGMESYRLNGHENFDITVNFTEGLTNKTETRTANLRLQTNALQLEFLPMTPGYFKPGLEFTGFVKLKNPDGTPPDMSRVTIGGTQRKMHIEAYRHKYDTKKRKQIRTVHTAMDVTVPSTGVYAFTLRNLSAEWMNFQLEAKILTKYNDTVSTSKYVTRFETRNKEMVQVTTHLNDGSVQPDSVVTFKVNTTEKVRFVYYFLTGKGNILEFKREKSMSRQGSREFTITETISEKMARKLAPTGRIVVWTPSMKKINDNDRVELLVDSAEFSVSGAMVHEVEASYHALGDEDILDKTKPGKKVYLGVKAEPNSHIAVLAVDKSVRLMGSDNDITEEKVLQDLKGYAPGSYMGFGGFSGYGKKRRKRDIMPCFSWRCYPYYSNSQYPKQLFASAEVAVFTDYYIHERPQIMRRMMMSKSAGGRGTRMRSASMPEASDSAIMRKGVAATGAPAGGGSDEPVVRKNFVETWLWVDDVTRADGLMNVTATAPDTITTWETSVIALNKDKGLGIADMTRLTVFKPFFVSLVLPYSVIRNEKFLLKVLVFNYQSKDKKVTITLKKSPDFTALSRKKEVSTDLQRTIEIKAKDSAAVSFFITPTKVGYVDILVYAKSKGDSDAVQRKLLVEAEGRTEEYSESLLLRRKSKDKTTKTTFEIELPTEGVVPGSQVITVSAIGDLMGSTTENLDRLIRQPSGCGEQNMINFAPNIYIMKYLTETDQLKTNQKHKLLRYMNLGLQRELTYKHHDGSYSAFGKNDKSGSTWLTAFVVRSFGEARAYIDVDEQLIVEAIDFLFKHQAGDGSFVEPGRVIHKELQGGSGSAAGRSAYILTAILQNKELLFQKLEKNEKKDRRKRLAGARMRFVKPPRPENIFVNADDKVDRALHVNQDVDVRQNFEGYIEYLKENKDYILGNNKLINLLRNIKTAIIKSKKMSDEAKKIKSFREENMMLPGGGMGISQWTKDTLNERLHLAINFLESMSRKRSVTRDPYILSLVSYCSALAGSKKSSKLYSRLRKLAINEKGKRHWAKDEDTSDQLAKLRPWQRWRRTKTQDVEMTAYSLLTYLAHDDESKATRIVKWLVSKKSAFGGWYSTQDTVVGLNAMATFASKIYEKGVKQGLSVRLYPAGEDYIKLKKMTNKNAQVLQKIEIGEAVKKVTVKASGSGVAIIQFSVIYNTVEDETSSSVDLRVFPTPQDGAVEVKVCYKWVDQNDDSGMGMLTMQSLSGYDWDSSELLNKYRSVGLDRIEFSGKTIMLYFDKIAIQNQCINITQYKSMDVADLQPALVHVYPYYQPALGRTLMYTVKLPKGQEVKACKVCKECCSKKGYE